MTMPLPLLIMPTMGSPGTGLQHRAKVSTMPSVPFITNGASSFLHFQSRGFLIRHDLPFPSQPFSLPSNSLAISAATRLPKPISLSRHSKSSQ